MCKSHTFTKSNHARHAYLFTFTHLPVHSIHAFLGNRTTKLGIVSAVLYQLSYMNKNSMLGYRTISFRLQQCRWGWIQSWAFTATVCAQIQPPHTQVHIRNLFVSIWSPLMSAVAGLPFLWLQWAHSRALVIQQNVCGADLSRAVRHAWVWI